MGDVVGWQAMASEHVVVLVVRAVAKAIMTTTAPGKSLQAHWFL